MGERGLLESSLETADPMLNLQWDEKERSCGKDGSMRGLVTIGDGLGYFKADREKACMTPLCRVSPIWLRKP